VVAAAHVRARIVLQNRRHRREPGERTVGNDAGPPPRVRREHAVIEDQVDPRARSQSGKLLEELHRLEERMARAIRPGRLQREQDAVIAQAPQPLLRDRRAE
jgi:hypothetical protein